MIRAAFLFAFLLQALFLVPAAAQSDESDWRQKLGTFRIGIVAGGRPVLETRRVQPFREALQNVLGMPVEVFAAPHYNALIEAHRASRIEYAVYSASAFSAAWLLCKCVTPVAAPVASDGSARFSSVVIARPSIARSVSGLRNTTVLVPGNDSFSGYLFPKDRLAREGIDMEEQGWTLRDMKTMDAALAAFIDGEGDAIFGWQAEQADKASADSPALLDSMTRLKAAETDAAVIWESPYLPYGPHAIRSGISEEARELIRPFLTGLANENVDAYEAIEVRHTGGFQPVGLEDYRPVIDTLRKPVLFSGTVPASDD